VPAATHRDPSRAALVRPSYKKLLVKDCLTGYSACSRGVDNVCGAPQKPTTSGVHMKPKTILVTALIAAVTVVVLNRTGVLK